MQRRSDAGADADLQPDFDNHGVVVGVAIQPHVGRDRGSSLLQRVTNDERFRVRRWFQHAGGPRICQGSPAD